MSFNRENVIWQSKDGTWNRGFYETLWVGSESDGDDPEWDVEYGGDFWWVSVGHASEQAAHEAWDGSNPGGYSLISYANNPTDCERLDAMARKVIDAAGRPGQWGRNTYADMAKQG